MEKPKLFGLKKNGVLVYIGKTTKIKENKPISKVAYGPKYRFFSEKTRKKSDFEVEIIDETTQKKWFDDKLINIVYYKRGNKLKNAKHLLDGRRGFLKKGEGYWLGKEKDAHTLKRLSESKHRRVLQFDQNGVLIKRWDSIKEAAIKVFKDYQVVNGSASSELYKILTLRFASRTNSKFFWIKEEDFLHYYPRLQKKISIPNLIKRELDSLPEKKVSRPKHKWVYSVEEYNNDGVLKKRHKTTYHAAKHYGVKPNYINKLCKSGRKNGISKNFFVYGQKIKVSYTYGL